MKGDLQINRCSDNRVKRETTHTSLIPVHCTVIITHSLYLGIDDLFTFICATVGHQGFCPQSVMLYGKNIYYKMYVYKGTTSTVYLNCKSRSNKTGSTSLDTRTNQKQRPVNQKGQKVNENKQWKEVFRLFKKQHQLESTQCLLNSFIL